MIFKVHSALKLDNILLEELESLKENPHVTAKILPYNSAVTQILPFLGAICIPQNKEGERL